MKKIIFGIMLNVICYTSFGQAYDDGLVSSHLTVNTSDAKYVSFIDKFREGINNVKNGVLTSPDGIATYYGVDIRNNTKFDQVVSDAVSGVSNGSLSANYLSTVKSAIDKFGGQYSTIGQFRNDLAKIAITGSLSASESEVLATLDLCTQVISSDLLGLSVTSQSAVTSNESTAGSTDINLINGSDITQVQIHLLPDNKIPRWLRCAFGVIGGAIAGGWGGAAAGAQVGAIAGPGGAAVGAVIGGISGVVGGVFTGAAAFCD